MHANPISPGHSKAETAKGVDPRFSNSPLIYLKSVKRSIRKCCRAFSHSPSVSAAFKVVGASEARGAALSSRHEIMDHLSGPSRLGNSTSASSARV